MKIMAYFGLVSEFIYENLKSLRKVLLKKHLTTLVKVNQSDFRTSGKAANLKKNFPYKSQPIHLWIIVSNVIMKSYLTLKLVRIKYNLYLWNCQ